MFEQRFDQPVDVYLESVCTCVWPHTPSFDHEDNNNTTSPPLCRVILNSDT